LIYLDGPDLFHEGVDLFLGELSDLLVHFQVSLGFLGQFGSVLGDVFQSGFEFLVQLLHAQLVGYVLAVRVDGRLPLLGGLLDHVADSGFAVQLFFRNEETSTRTL